ncbi:MAG: MarR family transcriptional regulator [Promethearchaeota archaeon Loki_b31]|nr:MAG: MarR family transcriptional regulator [Candidatus Lokiarchaeota archaeon Loki_b31]
MKDQREGGFLIAKIHQITNRIFKQMLKEYGIKELNPGQGRILFALWQNDNISIRELSLKTQLTKSTLTTMLDRLENAGFLNRKKGKDRRIIKVKLSEKSKNLQKKYIEVSKKMTEVFYGTLTEEEIDEFEGYLRRILDNLIKAKYLRKDSK